MKKRITIRFYIQYHLEYGQQLFICGSLPGLGGWDIKKAIKMNWNENDWWSAECQFEAISSLPKNNFRLETPYYYNFQSSSSSTNVYINTSNNNNNNNSMNIISHNSNGFNNSEDYFLGGSTTTPSPTTSFLNDYIANQNNNTSNNNTQYQLSNKQSLSPVLKGVSPQMVDLDYKYVMEKDYHQHWEQGKNHKLQMMIYSNDENSEEEEIYIEIRDEWLGGNEVFPTLDFKSCKKNHDEIIKCDTKFSFFHPLDSNPIPCFPSQIVTFFVTDEGSSESHSVNLVSHFFGNDYQKSLRMNPIIKAGTSNTLWIGQIYAPQTLKFDYRYVVVSNNNSGVYWEKEARTFSPSNSNHNLVINNDGQLRLSDASKSWIQTGFVGLQEQDYNCSILCIVQLLYHITPLKNIIMKLRGRIGFPFSQCLANIFTSMEKGFQTVDINPLQTSIGSNDAAEILDIVINALLEEITRITQITNDKDILINDLVQGRITQTSIDLAEDQTIRQIRNSNETFISIILPVKGHSSLESSFESYKHSTETYENQGAFENIISFEQLPMVLIFQLDRSDYQDRKTIKVSNKFTFPKKLKVDEYQYNLLGVLCHQGDDSFYNDGHFFIFVKKNKKWYKCDGSSVSKSNQKEAVFNSFGGETNYQAYILIYERK
ncbi:hypothetical protein CYY_007370 [Polysphondylium violaceum]|uniref:Uncharacterized protein n=1 Tax=Polysphondylium violaceum TaxID=133409 RepID=A0A8J4UY23_9MYCE|nr:hypothetical protein CYY_007370 [Polysphondylium violaceum]